jgi:hypothetical protein
LKDYWLEDDANFDPNYAKEALLYSWLVKLLIFRFDPN